MELTFLLKQIHSNTLSPHYMVLMISIRIRCIPEPDFLLFSSHQYTHQVPFFQTKLLFVILIIQLPLPCVCVWVCVCACVRVHVCFFHENKHTLPHTNSFLQTYRGSLVYESAQTNPLCVSKSGRTNCSSHFSPFTVMSYSCPRTKAHHP